MSPAGGTRSSSKSLAFGSTFAWAYWTMVSCNVLAPQLFWSKKLRTNIPVMFVVSIIINIGMWFERYVIIATSLNRDFLPSSWGDFTATPVDMGLYLGTFGLFFTLFLLFVRWIPMFAIAELKGVLPHAHPHLDDHGHDGAKAKGELAPAPAE